MAECLRCCHFYGITKSPASLNILLHCLGVPGPDGLAQAFPPLGTFGSIWRRVSLSQRRGAALPASSG